MLATCLQCRRGSACYFNEKHTQLTGDYIFYTSVIIIPEAFCGCVLACINLMRVWNMAHCICKFFKCKLCLKLLSRGGLKECSW